MTGVGGVVTPLRTRAIDAVTRETCPGFPATCWACRDTAERAVDALLAAGLLHDPTAVSWYSRIERAARAIHARHFPRTPWEDSRDDARDYCRDEARAALAAADPEEPA